MTAADETPEAAPREREGNLRPGFLTATIRVWSDGVYSVINADLASDQDPRGDNDPRPMTWLVNKFNVDRERCVAESTESLRAELKAARDDAEKLAAPSLRNEVASNLKACDIICERDVERVGKQIEAYTARCVAAATETLSVYNNHLATLLDNATRALYEAKNDSDRLAESLEQIADFVDPNSSVHATATVALAAHRKARP